MENEAPKDLQALFTRIEDGFAAVASDIKRLDQRFDGVDRRFDRVESELRDVNSTLNRHTVLLDEQSKLLRLTSGSLEEMRRTDRERLDIAKDAIDQRLRLLEQGR